MDARTMTPMVIRRPFRLNMRLLDGGRNSGGRGTSKVTRAGEGRQRASSGPLILGELRHQRVGAGKAHRRAEPLDDGDVHQVPVEVPVGVEEVRLDGAA